MLWFYVFEQLWGRGRQLFACARCGQTFPFRLVGLEPGDKAIMWFVKGTASENDTSPGEPKARSQWYPHCLVSSMGRLGGCDSSATKMKVVGCALLVPRKDLRDASSTGIHQIMPLALHINILKIHNN